MPEVPVGLSLPWWTQWVRLEMKRIVRVLNGAVRKNMDGGRFYLATVELSDGEIYTVAHSEPPKAGDKVYAYFDSKYDKPKASYPKTVDKNTVDKT